MNNGGLTLVCEGNIIIRKQANERISWLDVAKGLGIFIIVWGHLLRTGRFRMYEPVKKGIC